MLYRTRTGNSFQRQIFAWRKWNQSWDVFCGHPGSATHAKFETRSVKGESGAIAWEEMHYGPPSSPSNLSVITRGRVSCGRTRQ